MCRLRKLGLGVTALPGGPTFAPPSRATKDYCYVQWSWCFFNIQGRASKQHCMEIYVWIYACVCIHTHTRLETTDVSSLFAWSLLARKWSSVCIVLWRALSGKCILPPLSHLYPHWIYSNKLPEAVGFLPLSCPFYTSYFIVTVISQTATFSPLQ